MARVNRLLQMTLADMVPGLIKDPRIREAAIVSVVEVRTTPDLRQAKVYVSVMASASDTSGERQEAAVLEALHQARGFLRTELGRRVRLRHVPELLFTQDRSQENAAHIEQILKEIGAGDKEGCTTGPRGGEPPLESGPSAPDMSRARGGEPPPACGPSARDTHASSSVAEVVQAIHKGRSFLVTAHPDPDGDAIGSMAATLLVLEDLGKEVVAYNPDPVPGRFRFVPGTDRFTVDFPARTFDVTLVLDCSDDRMLPADRDCSLPGTIVVVDHHKTHGNLGHVALRDPGAAAVGVLLFRIFGELEVVISKEVAEALFCSLMSDTGSFRYQNTNPEALRVAAALLETGVDPWHVSSNLYEERPRCELDLLARVLQTLEVSADGLAASLVVTGEMLAQTGCTPDMVDGLINYARGVQGVEVALLFRPGDDSVRVSFRSRGTVDVAQVAQRFGGGGHHNAAGCVIRKAQGGGRQIDQIRAELFAEVSRIVGQGG